MKRFGKIKHVHFVGIGGIGMSGIAELLINLGYEVSGSDLKETAVTRRLSSMGAQVYCGHREENVHGADVVVYSSAVRESNPEIQFAKEKAIPVIPRAEMLAELMRLKYGVAIAGAHGKTTTTSMVASILTRGGLDPTVVIGGRLDIWGGSNAKLGEGDFLVAEADESDGSFLALSPTIVVVTNIDREHMDHYGDMDALRETFVQFMNKVPFYGACVICFDCEEIQGIVPNIRKRYVSYGLSSQAELRARDLRKASTGSEFEVIFRNESLGRVEVGMPGEHNVLNALAAIGVALELGLDIRVVKEGLKELGGLGRRFQIKGSEKRIMVMDDYGHHPTEIQATLNTARECWPHKRLVVVFQPHRYTRTRDLYERFVVSFNQADVLVVMSIYPAGEEPIEGVDAEWLARGIREHGHRDVTTVKNHEEALAELARRVNQGDMVITLGAGDVYKIGEQLLEVLQNT